MRILLGSLVVVVLAATAMQSRTLLVGSGQAYANPALAARDAVPGDTILILPGEYRGTFWIENLNGTETSHIVIRGTDKAGVVFRGGTESMHFSDCSWLDIENFTVTGQTGNGMNIDDGGTIDSPTHHIVIRGVVFTRMSATGNNDMLKLSGLDHFRIEDCLFEFGATGGSGADMVGCHNGVFQRNTFREMGSNAIQAKGGTQFITITRNSFIRCGERALNLGGSTGLQFFRPLDAPFEAADLYVYANVFLGSNTPIAYVGSVRVDVANNTIIEPVIWAFRVLQETVDPTRFAPCGQNVFRNNIVVYRSTLRSHVNIGGNTAPETFTLSNNLWYNLDAPTASKPNLGVMRETASIYGDNPLLRDAVQADATIGPTSPAVGKGLPIAGVDVDFAGNRFAANPSIGAFEGAEPTTSVAHNPMRSSRFSLEYGPTALRVRVFEPVTITWYNLLGRHLQTIQYEVGLHHTNFSGYMIAVEATITE